ncbi:MAG: SDR family oxidoreductase [Sandaracinaceae bacterium]|nr:SDR family oxidoreductase [Sandaracinaceae bacterium]
MSLSSFASVPVLVTGGAGFIGSHLVDALLAQGAKVRVLDDLSMGRRENLAHCVDKIDFIVGDMRDREMSKRACEGIEIVFHQAALGSVPRSLETPDATLSVNLNGSSILFTAARDAKVKRIVYASSSSVYGDSQIMPKKEGTEGKPLSPYAVSKAMVEQLADVFARCFGMEFLGLRYFNVYGPRQDPEGQYAAVIPRFFAACAQGKQPVIFGDGQQSRDFTYVGDVVRGNLLAAQAPKDACGSVYNIGAQGSITVKDLANTIIRLSGRKLEPKYVDARNGDVRHSQADATRAFEAFGFQAETTMEDGLRVTRDAYLKGGAA